MRQTIGLSSGAEAIEALGGGACKYLEEGASHVKRSNDVWLKGQLTALMQASHPWHEAAAMAGVQIGRSAAYQLLCNVRLRGNAALQGYLHVSCYRPQRSEHLGRWSSDFLVRNGTWLPLASLTNGKPKFQEIFPKKCRLPSFPELAT